MKQKISSVAKDKSATTFINQRPDKLLVIFLIFIVVSFWLSPFWQILIRLFAAGFLLWWSWLEMTKGTSTFRKILGFIACIAVLAYSMQFLL